MNEKEKKEFWEKITDLPYRSKAEIQAIENRDYSQRYKWKQWRKEDIKRLLDPKTYEIYRKIKEEENK